jgi:hypothetical protein
MASIIAGTSGNVTSPIPRRIISASGCAAWYSFTFFAILANK